MVLSSFRDGVWLSELTHPFWHLSERGIAIDLASPAGGAVSIAPFSNPLAPGSVEADDLVSIGFLSTPRFAERLQATLALATVQASDYDALHLVGGIGPTHDCYPNATLGQLVEAFWNAGKIVGAICHGVIGLANAEVDGRPLVAGRALTAFSLAEDRQIEDYLGIQPVVPQYPQAVLEAAGASYSARPPQQPYVVSDGNLLTGQNQQSATEYGLTLARMLAKTGA